MKRVLFAVLLSGAAVAQAQSPIKGDAEAARKKIAMCVGCHGQEQYKTAFPEVYHVPRIAGQSADYLTKALQAYKSGDRPHPSMRGIAATLSDQDMADLAAFYSKAK